MDSDKASLESDLQQLVQTYRQLCESYWLLTAEARRELATCETEFQQFSESIQLEHRQEQTRLENELTEKLEAARLGLEQRVDRLESQRAEQSDAVSRTRAEQIRAAEDDQEAALCQLADQETHDRQALEKQTDAFQKRCDASLTDLKRLQQSVSHFLAIRGMALQLPSQTKIKNRQWSSTLLRQYLDTQQQAANLLNHWRRLRSVRCLDEKWPLLVGVLSLLLLAYPIGKLTAFVLWQWLPLLLILSLGISLLMRWMASSKAHTVLQHELPIMQQYLVEAKASLHAAKKASGNERESSLRQISETLQHDQEAINQEAQQTVRQAEHQFSEHHRNLETAFTRNLSDLETAWEKETDQIRQTYLPLIEQRQQAFQSQSQHQRLQYEQRIAAINSQTMQSQEDVKDRCRTLLGLFQNRLTTLRQQHQEQFPDWTINWNSWSPAQTPSGTIPLGNYHVALDKVAAEPIEPELASVLEVPVLLDVPSDTSLLLEVPEDARQKAVDVLQLAMLRTLIGMPPAKVRMTIFDPIGLGQNFSAFLHLADFDERLITHRVWTETTHFETRLADLTEHMENVIQKYLRNEFASITQYNEHAGEVAEPYRFLVIADYPNRFSEEAVRRLASIVENGPRCGIFTWMSVQSHAKLPRQLGLDQLHNHMQSFRWSDGAFSRIDSSLCDYPLEFDALPDGKATTSILKRMGHASQESARVEVPFGSILPASQNWLTRDNSQQLQIPVGRSGANRILSVQLGSGTSQHVLIAGKTGSGKSTLLHAIITSSAIHYSPRQLQLYLIDFKKGVEFKSYAKHRLPHARVIANESEREFGLSVLQRLDEELRERGDLFRDVGAQDVAGFRKLDTRPMPRILLVVDEFQEFFVSDDHVGHEAALLLDRLVRQGRAFGIHVILGSQTLAGAYSLARSTLGQMAVRIALQCSPADAHLILSEENQAARLLNRPGEAIYNDSNGRVEGNCPFQVVWLSDEQRSDYLSQIRDLTVTEQNDYPPPIVFEGDAAAKLLSDLQSFSPSNNSLEAWVGAAIAIKPPTSITFRTRSGSNLLIVGQDEQSVAGIQGAIIATLSLAHTGASESRPQFFTLAPRDTKSPDGTGAPGVWLDSVVQQTSWDIRSGDGDHLGSLIGSLYEQLQSRQDESVSGPPLFLLVSDLGSFSELQADEEDFGLRGFSDDAEQSDASVAKQFAQLIREGPVVGIHVIVWADSYHQVRRYFDRTTMPHFSWRLLLQMSAMDSSHLMDSSAASQLGPHRAILYDESTGTAEKFRPYSPITQDLLSQIFAM